MGGNTFRYQEGERPASTYWRRRFIALVVGLAGFALLAWSVSGAIGGPKLISPAANVVSGRSGPAGGGARPGGAAATTAPHQSAEPSPQQSTPGHHPARHRHRTTRPRPVRKDRRPAPGKAPAKPKRPARRGHGGAHARPRACTRGSVVISLFASQVSYPAHDRPVFDVDVVSTRGKTCTFNVGAAYLALVIKQGPTRVWSSADCPQGRKSLFTDLVKGVPTMLSISWNRRTSSPGCKRAAAPVPAGTYSATAMSGKLASNRQAFRIR